MTHRVSIIIPTLNEAATLGRTLRHLSILDPPAWEILVVDGGSEDETVAIALAANISVIIAQRKGRSAQMNRGAEVVTGDVLCFLHADTQVPDDLVAVIDRTLADPTIAAGGFISLMSGATITRWGFVLLNSIKTYCMPLVFRPSLFFQGLRLLFGDQVMFCRRQDFRACGGFALEWPIMEEADLCLKLMRYGRICQVNRTVQSSDRRVVKWGSLKAILIYLYIGILWGLGFPATYLKWFYPEIR
jgi:rSAM/selenodomain-associated transferase 2